MTNAKLHILQGPIHAKAKKYLEGRWQTWVLGLQKDTSEVNNLVHKPEKTPSVFVTDQLIKLEIDGARIAS